MKGRPFYYVMDRDHNRIASVGFPSKAMAKLHRDDLNGGKHTVPDGEKLPLLRYYITTINKDLA